MITTNVILALCVASTTVFAATELSLRKPALQRDTGWGGVPGRAVDGVNDKNYGHKHCSHTLNGNDNSKNWWAVDLGQSSTIEKVVVHNRADCCGNRLANFDIVVLNDRPKPGQSLAYSQAQVCHHKTGAIRQGGTESYPCKASGRYVAIAQGRKLWLTLCGVQVYGEAGEVPRDLTNVAAGGIAFQRDVGWGGLPARAIDGNRDGTYGHNHCTHTLNNPKDTTTKNWWAVDLKKPASIYNVRVYNRADCCGNRLADFDVVVTDEKPVPGKTFNYDRNQICAHKAGPVKQGGDVQLTCVGTGQYVVIAQSRQRHLTLCLVQVMGKYLPEDEIIDDVGFTPMVTNSFSAGQEIDIQMFAGKCPSGCSTHGNMCKVVDPPKLIAWLNANAASYGIEWSVQTVKK